MQATSLPTLIECDPDWSTLTMASVSSGQLVGPPVRTAAVNFVIFALASLESQPVRRNALPAWSPT